MLLKQTVKQDNQSLKVTPQPQTKSAGPQVVKFRSELSTGFVMGIGFQLSVLVFSPIAACVVGTALFIMGIAL